MENLTSKEEYYNLKNNSPIFIAQFGAKTCLPCVSIKEKLGKWASEKNVKAVYIPCENFSNITAEEGIFSVPAVLVFVLGKLTIREAGYFSLEEVFERAERYLELVGD